MKDDRLLEMRVFRAVVEHGGFTAAARVLDVSQPFVSQIISALERRLGVTLLHRSTRTHRLTPEGEQFLAQSIRLLEDLEQMELQIRSPVPVGELRVSAPMAFGMDQVVPAMPEFMARYPQVALYLSLSDSMVNLLRDNFDVAIRMGRLQDSSLITRKLCDLQRVVVAAPSYIARQGQPVTPQGLAQHKCLLWAGPLDHLNRWPFMEKGRRRELTVSGDFRSVDGSSLFQMCVAGMGIMRLAEHLAIPAIRRGELVLLLKDYQARDDTAIHVLYQRERQLVPRIRAYVDYLVDVFREPPWLSSGPSERSATFYRHT
ncbi:LysR family transcriptional regulator [Verticiella sediminum]|uniref:LysR family transcriptional regulator n=1 Tax=Verticiella sediminum TaxID=1247510 RepID=A0A556AXE3_9BURK|nr:LysR family transcriptional regulator [Verticiella sediminum]TSH97613.1 LysR family transcriptional regulator [Verticiella sediminum]